MIRHLQLIPRAMNTQLLIKTDKVSIDTPVSFSVYGRAGDMENIIVDPSKTEALSVEFTAVILEKDTKHKLPEDNKARTLKDLARVYRYQDIARI